MARRHNLRIAVQKSGRLRESSMAMLGELGLHPEPSEIDSLITPCAQASLEIINIRHGDAPQYVQYGAADFAMVGGNLLDEISLSVRRAGELPFGACRLVVAVPDGSGARSIEDLEGERIATDHPHSLRKFLRRHGVNAAVIGIRGSVEIAPALGLADAVCDLVQSGKTMEQNRLRPICTIREYQAVLIESRADSAAKDELRRHLLPQQEQPEQQPRQEREQQSPEDDSRDGDRGNHEDS